MTRLRTELEDLREMKSRLLIDFPAGPFGTRRFVYVENRGGCDPGGNDLLLLPQRWVLGMEGPLVTAGPVSLHGILAQLYNPLAHGPGSEVFADPAKLSLDIDLEMAGRRGVQLKLIPGHWNLLGIYDEQAGGQIGSTIAIPFGRSIDCTIIGLLSAPPDRLEQGQSWYARRPLFPGGLVSVLAGSMSWERQPLHLFLAAAASAGRRVGPEPFLILNMSLATAPVDLALLFGYCSPRYFTPEGDTGDLEWLVAGRASRDIGVVRLSTGFSKELHPLPPYPQGFRGGCDRLSAGIRIVSGSALGRIWSIDADAEMQREWSEDGKKNSSACLQVGSTADRGRWNITGKASARWSEDSGGIPTVLIGFGWKPKWGKVELGAEVQCSRTPGFDLAAAVEATGKNKRLYFRLATKDSLNVRDSGWEAGDWLKSFALRVGWEAKFRR